MNILEKIDNFLNESKKVSTKKLISELTKYENFSKSNVMKEYKKLEKEIVNFYNEVEKEEKEDYEDEHGSLKGFKLNKDEILNPFKKRLYEEKFDNLVEKYCFLMEKDIEYEENEYRNENPTLEYDDELQTLYNLKDFTFLISSLNSIDKVKKKEKTILFQFKNNIKDFEYENGVFENFEKYFHNFITLLLLFKD
jgi:hypothetical protein